jgi:predicted transcriptional regulator
MTPADSQQQRMLERLRRAGDRPVAFAELRAGGIDFPAAVLSDLELSGHAIDRVHQDQRLVGVRLLEPESSDAPGAAARQELQSTAGALAGSAPVFIGPAEPLRRTAELMSERGVSHLIVSTDPTARPVGIISTLDLAVAVAWDRDQTSVAIKAYFRDSGSSA